MSGLYQTFYRPDTCHRADGKYETECINEVECEVCDGTGMMPKSRQSYDACGGVLLTELYCDVCGGYGWVPKDSGSSRETQP